MIPQNAAETQVRFCWWNLRDGRGLTKSLVQILISLLSIWHWKKPMPREAKGFAQIHACYGKHSRSECLDSVWCFAAMLRLRPRACTEGVPQVPRQQMSENDREAHRRMYVKTGCRLKLLCKHGLLGFQRENYPNQRQWNYQTEHKKQIVEFHHIWNSTFRFHDLLLFLLSRS